MQIHYQRSIADVSWESVQQLFQAVDWPKRDLGELMSAFTKSSFVRFAFHQKKIIGCGRTVDDGFYYGMIVDLIVDPEYQCKGIGSAILRQLSLEMKPFYSVTLTAAPGKEDFYIKTGWELLRGAYYLPRRVRSSPGFGRIPD